MTFNYFEEIFNSDFFNIIKKDNAVIINLKNNNNLIISSWLNGGIQYGMKSIVNQSIDKDDSLIMADGDFKKFQHHKFKELGLIPEKTAGLMTSACMDNLAISTKKYEQLEVTTIATAGADKNGIKAGDSASFYEYDNHYFQHFGTINIITLINANLHDGALITAAITATEAKTSVLQDLKVESQFSNYISTGTGTDGICIVSNKNSKNNIENAGKHSKLGELIAKTVQESVEKALFLQTYMCIDYQSTVLSRLSRFNISFEEFYKDISGIDKVVYASKFYEFNRNKENISFVSSIINLIDEVQTNLLTFEDTSKLIKLLIKSYLNVETDKKIEKIDDVLEMLIKSINIFLFD